MQRREAVTSQETEPKLPASVEGPPVEAWVGRGSPQGQAHCKVLLGLNPLGVCHQPCHRAGIPQGSVTSGQTTTREGVKPHPSADNWIKALLSKVLPTRARPSFSHPSHQESYTSLSASAMRGQTEAAAVSQQLKQKPYYRKLIMMKKQKVISPMKEQDKIPEKQLNEVEIGNLPEKEFRRMIVKMIQDLGKRMEAKIEKMQKMFTKDLEELKNKQTEMNNTLKEIHSRTAEAETQINDLEDRMVGITATEQNTGKRMKRNEDSLGDLWDITHTNVLIIGIPEGEERKGLEKIFEEINAENLPNMGKEIVKSRKHRVSQEG